MMKMALETLKSLPEVTNPNQWLNKFANNLTSQFGEDGIIEKILSTINDRSAWCVEFGASYGRVGSNTFNLIENLGYSAVLIEPHNRAFEFLLKDYKGYEKVIPIEAFVGFETEDSLDALLKSKVVDIPSNFDVLSIDIDGNDYHVWEAVKHYRPKVVIIEYNPTIPNEVEFVQSRDMGITHGSSLLSIDKLAKQKGYELVAVTATNAIFVDKKYFELFGIEDNSVRVMRTDESAVTYIFTGYDGTIFIRGCGKVLWHEILYKENKVQQVPKWLREYPGRYRRIRRTLAPLYWFLHNRNIL